MLNQKKLRIAVLYGGRSGEHEISLRSAASVIQCLDQERFEVILIAIDKQGRWLLNDVSLIEKSADVLPVYKDAPMVVLPPHPSSTFLSPSAKMGAGLISLGSSGKTQGIDVVFPVVHGPLCEDGTIQGLLELADVPYVGCGVLASAVAMDKDCAKRLARESGIPIVPFISIKAGVWKREQETLSRRIASEFGFPVFVKPANMGSSVGIHKVKTPDQLAGAVEDSLRYDTKILVEKAISAREIELSALESFDSDSPAQVSVPGEIVPTHDFYSYEAKYLDEKGARLLIPAPLTPAQTQEAQKIARNAFDVLGCEGMARVDLFLDKQSGAFYFNEVNTIPGFTSISMYPKLWEASGMSYTELLSNLIDLAIARHQKKHQLVRNYEKA